MSVKKPEINNSIRQSEKGAALAIAIIIMALMMAVTVGVIAIANSDTGITSSDTRRTQTFYVASAGIEKMTTTFVNLTERRLRPTEEELTEIEQNKPTTFQYLGYQPDNINQTIDEDNVERARRCAADPSVCYNGYPTVIIPGTEDQAGSQYAGLYGIVSPYIMQSTATHPVTGTRVTLQRRFNSYAVPLFQFGIFGDNDIEFHPGPQFNFNGRVHSNRNLYLGGNLLLEDKVTVGEELVYSVDRNGRTGRTRNVRVRVSGNNIPLTMGSVNEGPNYSGVPDTRGYFPDSPSGTPNGTWNTTSVSNCGGNNCFNNKVLTQSTGAKKLLLPLQLDGATPREIIKRPVVGDGENLSESRYANKADIRIYLDDNVAWASNTTGGVVLENFDPISLPVAGATAAQNALLPIVAGAYVTSAGMTQRGSNQPAVFVRGVKNVPVPNVANAIIPAGAGLSGRIRIEIIDSDGTARDVTTEILSMGVTVGEPNAIIHLQRPIWAAFVPGNRTMTGTQQTPIRNLPGNLSAMLTDNRWNIIDGEIRDFNPTVVPVVNPFAHYNNDPNNGGFLADPVDDEITFFPILPPAIGPRFREATQQNAFQPANPPLIPLNSRLNYNRIVPINVYNVREGWSHGWTEPAGTDNVERITQRGMTSIVEINMKNLSRWISGYYDNNLLAGTQAVSANIDDREGYVIYVSDRRGDGASSQAPDGVVNNENIYSGDFNAAQTLDLGEDVINPGASPAVDNDTTELPSPINAGNVILTQNGDTNNRRHQAICDDFDVPAPPQRCQNNAMTGLAWLNNTRIGGNNTNLGYFRRAVRLFDGEDLNPGFDANRISDTKGITVASENMVYIWGNYNTTGLTVDPGAVAAINPGGYNGDQIPASIACDAFFPLSRTWFDGLSFMFPSGGDRRRADVDATVLQGTAVRAGIIAGMNMSAMSGNPDAHGPSAPAGNERESRLAGGVHNFPRFLENWANRKWSYAGSLIVLFHSNQAMGQWNDINSTIYSPPERNWSFDLTYRDPRRLPPGTPFFKYVQPTNFRQLIDGTP